MNLLQGKNYSYSAVYFEKYYHMSNYKVNNFDEKEVKIQILKSKENLIHVTLFLLYFLELNQLNY